MRRTRGYDILRMRVIEYVGIVELQPLPCLGVAYLAKRSLINFQLYNSLLSTVDGIKLYESWFFFRIIQCSLTCGKTSAVEYRLSKILRCQVS